MDVMTAFLHPEIDQDDILIDLLELDNLGDLSEFGIIPGGTKTKHWTHSIDYGA